ncbi:MAG: DUF3343 domain-containing protein [Clostridia bacterium]|nr:DUF3343 domain-containing protein [Clostridia bacterium]
MKNKQNPICIAAIGSLTLSLKAAHALQAAELPAEVLSLSREETRQGCAYGVSFPCTERGRVKATLAAHRLFPTQYIERNSTP